MDLGTALIYLKKGFRISRKGWDGKDQYLVLAKMKECYLLSGENISSPKHDNIGDNFIMFVGTSGYQCGWLASQADMLANDWEVSL